MTDHIRQLVFFGELRDGERVPQREITPLSRIVVGNFYVTIPGSAEVTRRGVAELAAAITSRRPDAAEHACWNFIDAIGELVALRFSDRVPS